MSLDASCRNNCLATGDAVEAALNSKSCRDQEATSQAASWAIWPGTERGYIALDGDLPQIAEMLEALWFLRSWGHDTQAFLAARNLRGGPARP